MLVLAYAHALTCYIWWCCQAKASGIKIQSHCHEYGPQMRRMGMAYHNTDLSIAPMNKQTAIL